MLLSVIKYFKGYVYVRLSGYAPERFLNLCGSHDILIWNLKSTKDGYEFCISVAGFKQLRPILKKTRTHIRIQKRYGMPFELYHYRKRKMFAMGMLLFAGLIYYLSGFIWNIEVNGNSYLSEEVVLCFLSKEHASFGTKKKNIDCAALEETLRSRYPEVIWTSIKIYGTKMTVDIQENLLPEENYEEKKEETAHDIVAADDGLITEMITRSGTPVVTVGTPVKKGDVLVNGYVEILNDDGETAQYLYRTADADVIAKVTYSYHDEIPMEYEKKVPTGAEKITYQVRILDYLIKNPFFHRWKNHMKLCRMCHNFTLQIIFIFRFIWSDRPVWAIKMNKRRTQKRRQNDWLLRILRNILTIWKKKVFKLQKKMLL